VVEILPGDKPYADEIFVKDKQHNAAKYRDIRRAGNYNSIQLFFSRYNQAGIIHNKPSIS